MSGLGMLCSGPGSPLRVFGGCGCGDSKLRPEDPACPMISVWGRRSSRDPEAGKGSCALGTPGMGAQDGLSIRWRRENLLEQVREPSQLWWDRAAQKGPLRVPYEDRAVRGWMELAVNGLLRCLCPGADLVPGHQGSFCPPPPRGHLGDHPHSVESEPPSQALVSLTGI